jgi:hypothetical protein
MIMAKHVTFWKMKVLPGRVDDLKKLMEGEDDRVAGRGWEMDVVGVRKDNPNEVWGAVTWDTSERYYANAESSEQNAVYEKMRALLSEDPEWFDCDVIEERRA